MKPVQIVFSPTGGTWKVADIIASEFDETVRSIDLTDGKIDFENVRFDKENIVIFAVPSYGGRVPALGAQRIQRISGHQEKCILVCVYGNRAYEDTLVELKDLAVERGFQVIAAVAAVAEHSIMHQYGANRPDAKDEGELRDFAREIIKTLQADIPENKVLHLPGNHPYKELGVVSLVPKTDDRCINCGLCARKCPAQAIDYENNSMADATTCISCMRCISICPQSARSLDEKKVSALAEALEKVCSEPKKNELFL